MSGPWERYKDKKPWERMKQAAQGGDKVAPYGISGLVTGQIGNAARWGVFPEAMDTLTMGGSTKANAALGALGEAAYGALTGDGWNWSGPYDRNLQEQRADQAAYEGQNPVLSKVGKGTGIALGITSMPVIGTGLKGAAMTGAAYGGAGGALQDAGSIGERAANIATGIGAGTVIGGLGYGAGKLAAAGATKLSRALSLFRAPPDVKAAGNIYGLVEKRGGPAAVQGEMTNLGQDAALVDVLGERGLATARGAANINPDAREVLEGFALGRKAGQNQRVASDVERAAGLTVGNRKTVETMQKEAYDAVAPQINQAYAAAREAGYDLPLKQFDDILNTPMGRSAKGVAVQSMRNRYYDAPARPTGLEMPPSLKADRGQVNRTVREFSPSLGPRPAKPGDLLDFVKSKGGLKDFKGELRALDAKSVKGLVKENGIALDRAREAAAEAGYLDYMFGTPEAAVANSTVADFLSALDDNIRGNPSFSTQDGWAADQWRLYKDAQASRASIYEASKRVYDELGGGKVNDDVFRAAVKRVLETNENPASALDAARYDDYLKFGQAPSEVPPNFFGEDAKNFSNLAMLDEVKRSLDDVASSAQRAGENNKAGQASQLAKALRQRIDAAMEGNEYATARGLRQNAYKADEAFNMGAELGGPRVALDAPIRAKAIDSQFAPYVAKAYGATKVESLLNKGATEGALGELSTPLGKEAARAALGSRAADIDKAIQRERVYNRTARALTGNSTTARQLAEMAGTGLGTLGAATMMGYDATTGGIAGVLAALARRGAPTITKKLATDSQKKIAPYLAEMLTNRSVPQAFPVPAGILENLSKGGNDKLAKALLLLLSQHQNARPQTNPAQ